MQFSEEDIKGFSRDTLREFFIWERKELETNQITLKRHLEYFHSYLSNENMNAQTIIREREYIDKDYLED